MHAGDCAPSWPSDGARSSVPSSHTAVSLRREFFSAGGRVAQACPGPANGASVTRSATRHTQASQPQIQGARGGRTFTSHHPHPDRHNRRNHRHNPSQRAARGRTCLHTHVSTRLAALAVRSSWSGIAWKLLRPPAICAVFAAGRGRRHQLPEQPAPAASRRGGRLFFCPTPRRRRGWRRTCACPAAPCWEDPAWWLLVVSLSVH